MFGFKSFMQSSFYSVNPGQTLSPMNIITILLKFKGLMACYICIKKIYTAVAIVDQLWMNIIFIGHLSFK